MVSRELGPDKPHGGLLADVMGLGKTLETLATMVGNPPTMEDIKKRQKATLIVLPSSAIKQWMEEIRTHVEERIFPRVMHYKASKEIPIVSIEDCDIVLTSYTEVMRSYSYPSQEDMDSWSTEEGIKRWRLKYLEIVGDLHKIHWYRIVLDEALVEDISNFFPHCLQSNRHAIKNYKSRTSLACQSLRGQFRWALSGKYLLINWWPLLTSTPCRNTNSQLFRRVISIFPFHASSLVGLCCHSKM
jgi:SNF2 family DNA or RNA helicase